MWSRSSAAGTLSHLDPGLTFDTDQTQANDIILIFYNSPPHFNLSKVQPPPSSVIILQTWRWSKFLLVFARNSTAFSRKFQLWPAEIFCCFQITVLYFNYDELNVLHTYTRKDICNDNLKCTKTVKYVLAGMTYLFFAAFSKLVLVIWYLIISSYRAINHQFSFFWKVIADNIWHMTNYIWNNTIWFIDRLNNLFLGKTSNTILLNSRKLQMKLRTNPSCVRYPLVQVGKCINVWISLHVFMHIPAVAGTHQCMSPDARCTLPSLYSYKLPT